MPLETNDGVIVRFAAPRLAHLMHRIPWRSTMKEDVMSATSATRRELLAATAVAGAASVLSANLSLAAEDASIRPFHISVPEEQLVDLRRRIAATRWPEKE